MTDRPVLRGFAVVSALALVAVLAGPALAQSAPVRVVQGSDGTLYVVKGNSSWTLVPDQLSDADAAALTPSGEIDGTLPNDVLVIQAPEAPPAAAPAPLPAPIPVAAPAPAAPVPAPAPAAPTPMPAPRPSAPPVVTIGNQTENQNVSGKGGASFTITGSAMDPVAGVGAIDSVEVWIFGERQKPGATPMGQATLLSDGSWSLTFLPTHFVSTDTNIYVYVQSRAASKPSPREDSTLLASRSGASAAFRHQTCSYRGCGDCATFRDC